MMNFVLLKNEEFCIKMMNFAALGRPAARSSPSFKRRTTAPLSEPNDESLRD